MKKTNAFVEDKIIQLDTVSKIDFKIKYISYDNSSLIFLPKTTIPKNFCLSKNKRFYTQIWILCLKYKRIWFGEHNIKKRWNSK